MTVLRTIVVAAALALAGGAQSQLLVEVTLAPAIASQLFPPVSFPTSSLRVAGGNTAALIARVSDAPSWTGWEVYTASGFAAALEPAIVYDVERGLLLDGFFREGSLDTAVGAERHTRIVFADGTRRALLYLIRTDRELVWLVARSR